MAALMGLEASGVAQVVNALETKTPPSDHLATPTGMYLLYRIVYPCRPPDRGDLVVRQDFPRLYRDAEAAAGEQAEAAKEETMKKYYGNYLLMIEGSLPTKDEAYCCVGGKSALQITEEAAAGAKAIIAWGNCASAGCVQAANPNPTGAKGIHKVIKGKPIINDTRLSSDRRRDGGCHYLYVDFRTHAAIGRIGPSEDVLLPPST